jgi:hypothetical protein
MDALTERLDTRLKEWQPDVAQQVKEYISEIMNLADQDGLDILRLRTIEQEVLNLLDEP